MYLRAHCVFHRCLGCHRGKWSLCESHQRSAEHQECVSFLFNSLVPSRRFLFLYADVYDAIKLDVG